MVRVCWDEGGEEGKGGGEGRHFCVYVNVTTSRGTSQMVLCNRKRLSMLLLRFTVRRSFCQDYNKDAIDLKPSIVFLLLVVAQCCSIFGNGRRRGNAVRTLLHDPPPSPLTHTSLFGLTVLYSVNVTPDLDISYVDFIILDEDVAVYGEVTDANIVTEKFTNHFGGLVVRVPGYRSISLGLDPRHVQIFMWSSFSETGSTQSREDN
uniref:(California timema) hypothetical protein n=1 Tax=Timema californicum TaxID=61474 RepID=A0A7R9J622_TIMCA|nr:unnamed protein product [Timema californicum]